MICERVVFNGSQGGWKIFWCLWCVESSKFCQQSQSFFAMWQRSGMKTQTLLEHNLGKNREISPADRSFIYDFESPRARNLLRALEFLLPIEYFVDELISNLSQAAPV